MLQTRFAPFSTTALIAIDIRHSSQALCQSYLQRTTESLLRIMDYVEQRMAQEAQKHDVVVTR